MNPLNEVVVVSAQLWSNLLVQFGTIGQSSAIRQRNLNVNLPAAVCSVTSYLLRSVLISLSLYQSIVIMEITFREREFRIENGTCPTPQSLLLTI